MKRERKQELVEDFIKRAGFHEGYGELESQARLMAEHAVLEIKPLHDDISNKERMLGDMEKVICEVVDEFAEEIATLKAKIERKDEAIVKAKLEIEKQQTWTGRAWKQNHIADAIANKVHRYLEQTLSEEE